MPFLCRNVFALCLIAALCQAQTAPLVKVTVKEGSGAVVPRNTLSSRSFVVLISAPDGRPLPHATVNFRLPAEGPSGVFSSGFRSESVLADGDGLAYVRGIQWGDLPGNLQIRVSASHDGQRAETFIPVEISGSAVAQAADRRTVALPGRSGAKKWLLLAAVAGGALAGIAVAGGKSSTPAPSAVVAPVITAPTIGAPTITVGRP